MLCFRQRLMCTFVSPALWLLVVNFWTHLYRGHSSPGTHPEPSSLHPPAPSQCCVKSAPDEAAVSLQTAAGGRKTEGMCENCAREHYRCRIQAVQRWKSFILFWRTRFTPINVFTIQNFVKWDIPFKGYKIRSCLRSQCLLWDWFSFHVAQISTNNFCLHSQHHKLHKGQSNWFSVFWVCAGVEDGCIDPSVWNEIIHLIIFSLSLFCFVVFINSLLNDWFFHLTLNCSDN